MKNKELLQSEEWRKFQESFGRRTFHVEHKGFRINIIEHKLPMVGNYFYVPRGEVSEKVINLAKKEKAGWVRFDPKDEKSLENLKAVKAPHDMQPREIFVIDIAKSEEELLAEMKQKTRYNINLSQKRGVFVKVISNFSRHSGTPPRRWQFPISNKIPNPNEKNNDVYFDKFIELVKLTAKRKGINFHPENYYRKMAEAINSDILSLYVAEYKNRIIAANLVAFYEDTAIYLHGATDDEYRNMMAPYLLQWRAIKDAKTKGCGFYDFGGVRSVNNEQGTVNNKDWSGITKFKLGFSPNTKPIEFLGSWDIIINPLKYWTYRIIQKLKSLI